MKGFSLNKKSLIIGFLLGLIIAFFILLCYSNITFVSQILTSIYLQIVALGSIVATVIGLVIKQIKKPKIVLVIEATEFIAKGFDHNYIGYQLKALVMNKGKKICLDLDDISVVIKDRKGNIPNLFKVNKKMTDNQYEITLNKEQMREVNHCWIDKKGQVINVLKEMRQNDPYYLVFPCETVWGGLIGNEEKSSLSSSYSSEYLLDLKNEEYTIEIKVKGEDSEKNTIIKKSSFKIKPTIHKFTTTKDTEIGGLRSRINQLERNIERRDSKVFSITKQITKLENTVKEKVMTNSERKKEINQLNVQISNLENDNSQKDQQIKRLRKQQTDLMKEIERLKNPPEKNNRIK